MKETDSKVVLETEGGIPEGRLLPPDGPKTIRIEVPKRWEDQEIVVYEKGKDKPVYIERDVFETCDRSIQHKSRKMEVFHLPAAVISNENKEYQFVVREQTGISVFERLANKISVQVQDTKTMDDIWSEQRNG